MHRVVEHHDDGHFAAGAEGRNEVENLELMPDVEKCGRPNSPVWGKRPSSTSSRTVSPGGGGPALRDVSLEIAPGETVALVGHSGAGKTTCASLLMRFWDADAGTIAIGGHDVRQLPQHNLRELIAWVPQDIYLFNTSLRENIRMARPGATDAEVENAARTALAHDFITEMPRGYETVAGERGVQMSGGQRQRIAIARALLKDSPVLVLDEAVSSLDTRNEQDLNLALQAVRRGRATLVIAHRLSTIRSADRIVVLAEGRVAEEGTHDNLRCSRPAFTAR